MTDQTTNNNANRGSVSVGQNYAPITVTNHFVTQSGLTEEAIRKLEMQYLRRLIADCGGLDWLSLMNLEEGEGGMCLDAVYTELLTEFRDKQELPASREDVNEEDPVRQGRLSAVELLNREPRLVLLGDPGSGKSAFVNFVALCLAGEQLGDSVNLMTLTQPLPDEDGRPQTRKVDASRVEVRQDWSQGVFIPLRIILRDFSASASFPNDHDMPETHHLLEFLQSDLKRKGCEAYFKVLEEHLRNGQVLVMLDGLDEVPRAGDRRKHLVACIDGFVKSFGACRYLVTCRPYAYRDREWQLPGFASGKLAAFERGQIIRFIERWYDRLPALDRATTAERGKELQHKVLGRPDSRDLARRPLLLSLIACLHAYHHEWPERRADLYESLLKLLVNKWEKARFNVADGDAGKARQLAQASLAEFLQIGQDAIRKVLEKLAFQAHTQQGGQQDTADIAAKELKDALSDEAEDVNVAELFEYLRDRVGILYQRGGSNEQDAVYTFPHRSFQEYLSAAYLRREEKALFNLFPKQSADLVDDTWQELIAQLARADPDRWREVVILAGGIRVLCEPGPVWRLLQALTERDGYQELSRCEAWGFRLAGEILAESVALSDLNPKREKYSTGYSVFCLRC
ncbi:hypothetical protein SAMN05421690_1001119 [Nitrosomonas sp. Nm51]|uniref:NACHT domain-containing protein n=1 Tax=Nitrosomonas sp. Nm51 TaxID=133720 RepID=UPI0008D6DE47|nr:hypothetical protein [Nitrosomonas sp. Nm51]SEQ77836.1 hypothetical protein SAMN05421690_1001119 [Nitrosomonas sp. Nm51]